MENRRASYSYILRAIGQSLEEKRIVDFDLLVIERNYEVRNRTTQKPIAGSALRRWWRGIWEDDIDEALYLYTPVDIEWLNYRGEGQRRVPDQAPDFAKLSTRLRTIGAYIDLRRMRLAGMRRRGDQVTLRLEEQDGTERTEEHTMESFEGYSQFLRTKTRASGPSIDVDFDKGE
ncbi:MAG: hypothetical protein FJ145_18190 [Deltaproteobacteria bacterium]|nr:hypothetical protein [Deltaproteobacteria bacterium]